MAQIGLTVSMEWSGLDQSLASFQSIAEAADRVCLGPDEIVIEDGCVSCMGMTLARIEVKIAGSRACCTITPTASMILFVAAIMAKLPATAKLIWRDGWPFIDCPPRDDGDREDDPAPLAPSELEPA